MHEDLMGQVAAEENLRRALEAVKRNRGAAGIDGMTSEQLEPHFARHGGKIRAKLLAGRWTPSPVRRVKIPKPNGGKRLLGIPTVMDRLVQQALLEVLQSIFDPLFSESSYGFRPGRSAHDAVRAAQGYVREGRDWVVDIDIAQFFDHVHHDILMRRVAQVIRDKRVLRLIGRYLRAGVLVDGNWIGTKLRLQVNKTKSGAGRPWERKFLGFRINRRKQREVARESIARFKKKVREIWRGGRPATSRQLLDEWRRYVIGWWGYYRLAEDRRRIFELEGWIRRHIRKCFWLRWHSERGRYRKLRRLGVPEEMLRFVPTRRGAWFVARQRMMHTALSNRALLRYGFVMPSDLAAGR